MDTNTPLILVVVPDAIQRDIITLALKRNGYQVFFSNDGSDAVDMIDQVHPNIIILDLFLPQMNGLEIMARIRENGKLSTLTIIAISSLGFPEVVERVREAGAFDFLVKPFDSDTLLRRVSRALNRRDPQSL